MKHDIHRVTRQGLAGEDGRENAFSAIPIVVLLGAARSGTTLLGSRILSHHPNIAYWGEPDHVWSYGTQSRSDVRSGIVAPEVSVYIRKKFWKYAQERGGSVILEKTPANCLRVPFVRAIFPEARFIHLIRDGRDVVLSARAEWEKARNRSLLEKIPILYTQMRQRRLGVSNIPTLITRGWDLLTKKVRAEPPLWGPRIADLEEIYRNYSLIETCAIQWRECVESVLKHWDGISENRRLVVYYEDLVDNPRTVVSNILEFLDLEVSGSIWNSFPNIKKGNTDKWRKEMSPEELRRVLGLIGPTLQILGYRT